MANSNTSQKYIESLHPEQIDQIEKEEQKRKLEAASLAAGFDDSETIEEKTNVFTSKEWIIKTLTAWAETKAMKWYLITHDKDIKDTGEPVPVHYHIVIKFTSPTKKEQIIKKFPIGYAENTKNLLASVQYLIHKNNPEKHTYDWSELETNDLDLTWAKVTTGSQGEVSLTGLLDDIHNGKLKEYQLSEIDHMIYTKYKTRIDNAFIHYTETIMRDKKRNIEIWFLTGATGAGKTTFACDLADSLTETPGSYCISSGSKDAMQDYKGEPVLILDDLRADSFKLHDFLKLTDNNTRSSTNSRYKNKPFTGDFIIITSIKPITAFYSLTPDEEKEQLYRRIRYYLELTKETITFNAWDSGNRRFTPYKYAKNYISEKYPTVEPSPEDSLFQAVEKLGLTCYPAEPITPANDPALWSRETLPTLDEAIKETKLNSSGL